MKNHKKIKSKSGKLYVINYKIYDIHLTLPLKLFNKLKLANIMVNNKITTCYINENEIHHEVNYVLKYKNIKYYIYHYFISIYSFFIKYIFIFFIFFILFIYIYIL
jgi:hypothetical protein